MFYSQKASAEKTLKYSRARCWSSISEFFCKTSDRRTSSILVLISGNKLIILIYAERMSDRVVDELELLIIHWRNETKADHK